MGRQRADETHAEYLERMRVYRADKANHKQRPSKVRAGDLHDNTLIPYVRRYIAMSHLTLAEARELMTQLCDEYVKLRSFTDYLEDGRSRNGKNT